MDIEARFKETYAQVKKEETAKAFLMRVVKVREVTGDADSFVAYGFRTDNEAKVAVAAKKSTSGQHVPVEGSVLRAEKITRVPSAKTSDIAFYKSEYFHTFLPDSFCLQAIVQPTMPRKNDANGMWSAQVNAFDIDTNDQIVTADRTNTDLDEVLVKMLMPWTAEVPSSITHDIKGDALWGDGLTAKPGFSPFVLVRILNQSFPLYGKGFVKQELDGKMSARLPTEDEVLSIVRGNPKLQSLKATIKTLPVEELPKLSIALIPGLSITVGRESMSGAERAYLAIPKAFDWTNRNLQDDKGNAVIHPGFRKADVHIKTSRTNRMIVAHAVRSIGSTLTGYVPESAGELEVRERREAKLAKTDQMQGGPTEEQHAVRPDPVSQERQAAPAPVAAPMKKVIEATAEIAVEAAESDFFEPSKAVVNTPAEQHEAFDYSVYADDLRAMESMNADSVEPDDIQDLLDEAALRTSTRRPPRPTLG
ncbi:hypothetical protein [Pseudomonas syringae]|uniref:hypothetical protein n=1 Tax=Pseudomonas syringae TaxID=317 RepID=UPI0024601733|nr:hypothetical protein [Pseudomonas syringae]MDH4602469.1 hypothetical protein [Pseudomonas syringae pv. papulans]